MLFHYRAWAMENVNGQWKPANGVEEEFKARSQKEAIGKAWKLANRALESSCIYMEFVQVGPK